MVFFQESIMIFFGVGLFFFQASVWKLKLIALSASTLNCGKNLFLRKYKKYFQGVFFLLRDRGRKLAQAAHISATPTKP